MRREIQHVYVLGLGAIGAKYASMIYDVDPACIHIIVDEERKERYQREGIFVNDHPYAFDYVTEPNKDYPADLIILGVKSLDLELAIERLRPFVQEDTVIISLLNGIGTAAKINHQLGKDVALPSVVYMDAVKVQNRVSYGHRGKVVFGETRNTSLSDRVKAVCSFFDKMHIDYVVPEDMLLALWQKFLINVVGNQLTFMVHTGYEGLQDNPYMLFLVQQVGEEVIRVANAQGIALSQADIDNMIATMRKINPKAKTSMVQDREQGRKSEVEIFAGEIIRQGQKLGIPTPYNVMMYNLIKAYEWERDERKK